MVRNGNNVRFNFFIPMDTQAILTLIIVPLLIEPLVQLTKKYTPKLNPLVIVAVFSVIGGSVYLAWQSTPEDFKAWALAAYPVFAAGAIATHKFIRPFFVK